jgi:hypothetical protein
MVRVNRVYTPPDPTRKRGRGYRPVADRIVLMFTPPAPAPKNLTDQ